MHPLPRHRSQATKHAWALLKPAAERGLLHRPLHLILGPSAVPDCLSPYCRDLRDTLEAWASQQEPDPTPKQHPEDQLYAVADQFCNSRAALLRERKAQERLLGISEHSIDSRRLDSRALDSRLAPEALSPYDGVFVLAPDLNPGLEPQNALALVELAGASLQSIAISWPKDNESENFVAALRTKYATPLHLLDHHPERKHASACRYLNNLSSPAPQPEASEPAPKTKPEPLPKKPGPGPYLRIKV